MKYKVVARCAGFRNALWEKGMIVDVSSNEKPPKYFVPLEEVKEPEKKTPIDPRAPVEVAPGRTLEVKGGFAGEIKKDKLDRILTTDKVPNKALSPKPPTRRKKKDAGSVKK